MSTEYYESKKLKRKDVKKVYTFVVCKIKSAIKV